MSDSTEPRKPHRQEIKVKQDIRKKVLLSTTTKDHINMVPLIS